MEMNKHIGVSADRVFVRRLQSMGATASGAESVLNSILENSVDKANSFIPLRQPKRNNTMSLDHSTALPKTQFAKSLARGALALAALAFWGSMANAASSASSVKLLTAKFAPRQVVQIEVGDFHFKPGQIAPIHTHRAPAVGYVAKGTIIYQVEGEKPQILRAGDAFFEPAGPRILRFDNASATEEAVFLDFNLEKKGEPFIVFEKPPTEAIDRRSLPTISLGGRSVDQVGIYSSALPPSGTLKLKNRQPTLGLVAEGVVELRIKGKPTQRIVAGGSFALPTTASQALIANASSEVTAKIITFVLN